MRRIYRTLQDARPAGLTSSSVIALILIALRRARLPAVLLLAIAARGYGQQLPPPAPAAAQQPSQPNTAPSGLLTRDEAVRLALAQASNFQQARFAELIAAEDVKQARAAFLPRFTGSASTIYNSPSTGLFAESFSFIEANAIREYQAIAAVSGEIDLAGRLRATLGRDVALLEAARAGTEVARRALVLATDEAYYGLALASSRLRVAEQNLAAAEEFEKITQLLLSGGEVAPVDLVRARLQTGARRDELEQALAGEATAAQGLRFLVGYDFAAPVAAVELLAVPPAEGEIDRFTQSAIAQRPEFIELDAERRAAEHEERLARAERLPQISYNIAGGFDADSLHSPPLREHTGVLASVSISIPIFDWGASKSRELQARLRRQTVETQRVLASRAFLQQFYTARAQALSAAARFTLARSAVTGAEQNVQISVARYRAGEAPILEVTDAQTRMADARASLFQALFDYQIARARLAQAAGP